MRILIAIITVLISACAGTSKHQASNQVDNNSYNARYNELIEIIKKSATLEDFKALRDVYVLTKYYKPYLSPERAISQRMFEAINTNDWQACIDSANTILDFNYISLSAHYGAMMCSFSSEDLQSGKYHKYVLSGLLDAIWATGDGDTVETAFYCTSSAELQAFIQLHGLQIIDQALIHQDGKSFDLMGVKDLKRGKEFKWYFDISTQWAFNFSGLGLK